MKLDIHPLVGVGRLRFGSRSDAVRLALGSPSEPFRRSKYQTTQCDYFRSLGIFAHYSTIGLLEALEFAAPADPLLSDQRLRGIRLEAAVAILQAYGADLTEDSAGVSSVSLGVSLYAPLKKDDPWATVDGVLVHARGYYD
jgi:hypothetical protein